MPNDQLVFDSSKSSTELTQGSEDSVAIGNKFAQGQVKLDDIKNDHELVDQLKDPDLTEVIELLTAIGAGEDDPTEEEEPEENETAERLAKVSRKKSKKKLALQLARILEEIDQQLKAEAKQEKVSFWRQFAKKLLALKGANKAQKYDPSAAKKKTVRLISAELERALIRLRSASRIDSDSNDLALLQDMALVMRLSTQLCKEMPSFRAQPNPMVELARRSIAEISLDFKNSSVTAIAGLIENQKFKVATQSIISANTLHLNEATSNVNPMINSFKRALSHHEEIKPVRNISEDKAKDTAVKRVLAQAIEKKDKAFVALQDGYEPITKKIIKNRALISAEAHLKHAAVSNQDIDSSSVHVAGKSMHSKG